MIMILPIYKLNQLKDTKGLYSHTSGIYALLLNGKVIYIGQSIDVRARLLCHANTEARIKEIKKGKYKGQARKVASQRYLCIRANFDKIEYVVQETDPALLNKTEKYYIKKYKPKYNIEGIYKEYHGVKKNS